MLRTREVEQYVIKAFKVKLDKCELEHYSKGITKVGFYDPKNARKAIYQFATYFRREFGYDFIQYSMEPDRSSNDKNTKAFLFHHYEFGVHCERLAYGACCFRYRSHYTNVEPHWELQWIWLHPLSRGQGELSRHWALFEEMFGNFMVGEPLSKSMEYFIKNKPMRYKHDYAELMKEE